ncbi:MAG: hypothetical protein LC127_03535 [Chitinophagales bacterium]|nr:hypothetical protein [Chitinophagales bacterium]
MSDLIREAQQSTNIWGDDFFGEATQGAQRADSEFTELKDTMQEISKTVSRLGDDFYRSIYAGASGRSATQVPLEDVRKIQRQLQEEMSKFGTDINLNTFRQALNSTALYFDKDLNFMVKVLTTNKAAFRDEWRNMAADGIDAMEFLYDKLVYSSIVPDGTEQYLEILVSNLENCQYCDRILEK